MARKPADKSPAFQFYPKDFMAAEEVRTMELDEVGAYIILLCSDWNEGSIPDDERKVGMLLHGLASSNDLPRIWAATRPCFKPTSIPGRLTNPRLAAERKKQKGYRDKQRKKAEKRWGKSPKETNQEPVENYNNNSSLDGPGTTPVQDGTKKGEVSGDLVENSQKNTPSQDTDNTEDVCNGNATVMPRQCSSSSSSSSTTCTLNNSPNTKTSSAFDHQATRNPEVSPIGDSKSSPHEASSNQDTPTGPEQITSLADFKAARPSCPQTFHSLAFEIIDSLSLPDELAGELEELIAAYPITWTRDCLLTTRDKQQRIAEGTDPEGFTVGPLQYLAGSLEKKLKELRKIVSEKS